MDTPHSCSYGYFNNSPLWLKHTFDEYKEQRLSEESGLWRECDERIPYAQYHLDDGHWRMAAIKPEVK